MTYNVSEIVILFTLRKWRRLSKDIDLRIAPQSNQVTIIPVNRADRVGSANKFAAAQTTINLIPLCARGAIPRIIHRVILPKITDYSCTIEPMGPAANN